MIYEKEKRYIVPFHDVPSERQSIPSISLEDRKGNMNEVETGFTEDQAVMEAKRCLSCRRCLGCALCWAECKPEAIDFDLTDTTCSLEFDEVVLTPGQDNDYYPITHELGYGTLANVITDLQFERMLSPNGPTGGVVMSPLNGEVPAKLAIVQSRPEGNEEHLTVSATLGINEAILARREINDLEVFLFSPMPPSLLQAYAENLQKMNWLCVEDSQPISIQNDSDGERLNVVYRKKNVENSINGFDLVVVLTQPRLSPELKTLADTLGKEIQDSI